MIWVVCELPPVDSGYRGEIHPFVSNVGNEAHRIIIPEFFSLYHRILQQILLQNLEPPQDDATKSLAIF